LGFAGALRRSELCAIEVEHITWKPRSLELLIPGRRRTPKPRVPGSAFRAARRREPARSGLFKRGSKMPASNAARCSALSRAMKPCGLQR
jgi:integrase